MCALARHSHTHWSPPGLPANNPNFRFIPLNSMEIYIFVLKLTSFILLFISHLAAFDRCVCAINSSTNRANSAYIERACWWMAFLKVHTERYLQSFQIKRKFPRHQFCHPMEVNRTSSSSGQCKCSLYDGCSTLAEHKMPWPSNESSVEIRIESCFLLTCILLPFVAFCERVCLWCDRALRIHY